MGDIYATSLSLLDYDTNEPLANSTNLKKESSIRPRSVSPKKSIKSGVKIL